MISLLIKIVIVLFLISIILGLATSLVSCELYMSKTTPERIADPQPLGPPYPNAGIR